jgi:apolipoprotein D and lipocalin family protein
MRKNLLNLTLLLSFLTGCGSLSFKDLPDQPTVEHLELEKFMGRWYVIASIPTSFEEGAFNAIETYTWNEKEDRVDIDFRFRVGRFDGPEKVIPQKGFIYNKTTNAEWRIQPFWPLKFPYLVVDLAPDYSDTIIGMPNRQYVWIMARTPKISESRYNQLVEKVRALGYDMNLLKKVPQATN